MNAHASSDAPRGFAGLSSLVSVIPPAAAPPVPKAASPKPAGNGAEPAASAFGSRPVESKPFWNKGAIIGGGALLLFIGWLIANTPNRSAPPAANANANPYVAAAAVQQPAAPPQPAYETEEKPPVGPGLALTANQVRYCLSEDVRLEVIRAIADRTSDTQIANFNARISDFNSRCSSYKYRKSDMERVRSDVEANRYQLQMQARAIVAGW